ncbi:MAG: ComEC/Rec2 family competence protein [Verrucomicrobia bacterium]|nr:ComEC/Rec2 family competence protein [Verrucomicrobiota bacterium]
MSVLSTVLSKKSSPLKDRAPLLLWGLYFLIGCSSALYRHWIYILPLLLLTLFSKRKWIGWFFCIAGFVMAFSKYTLPAESKLQGHGIFSLESIQPTQSPFKRSIALKGTLKTFEADGKTYSNIPCTLIQNKPPPLGTKWKIHGTLENKERLLFKPDKNIPWEPLKATPSLVRFRFKCKESVRSYFHHTISDRKTAHFFASIATGDIDQWLLAMEFRKVGLGHILAISGLHFALIATLLGTLLRAALPPRPAYIILLALLLLYFIFLGITPSVLRAFTMITLYVLGILLKRPGDPLNLLGAALLIELILDPLTISNVGFQLSFLATIGILLFHTPFNTMLQGLLPERKFGELKQFSLLDKHGYLLASAIRNGLALNLAVHLTTLPAMFYIFHCFPLLSIPFNLFLTPLLGIAIMLLPLGALIPPLGKVNALYTKWLLQIIANPPEILNFKIFVNSLPFPMVITLTSLICAIGLTKREQTSKIGSISWRS